jgi:Mlc titration factor MtfA (ptsG expression regulator)
VWHHLQARYRRWRIARHPIPERLWAAALQSIPYAAQLAPDRRRRLRDLTTLFLLDKHFSPAHELIVTDAMRVCVAIKACVPVLELGIGYYSGFKGVVLYPADFRVREQQQDEAGVVHEMVSDLCGQSLSHGPMVLSWGAIAAESAEGGQDLVVHECAHKLDMLTGDADGFPPLHRDMSARAWTRAFRAAYDSLCDEVDAGHETRLDPYAAEDPAEFFAVASETFFTRPDIIAEDFPAVYAQLAAFYKQDPRAMVRHAGHDR